MRRRSRWWSSATAAQVRPRVAVCAHSPTFAPRTERLHRPPPPKPGVSDLVGRFCVDAGAEAPQGARMAGSAPLPCSGARVLTAVAPSAPAPRPGGCVHRGRSAGPRPTGPQGPGAVLGWRRRRRPPGAQALLLQRRHGGPPAVRHHECRVLRVRCGYGGSCAPDPGAAACSAPRPSLPRPPLRAVVRRRAAPLRGRFRHGRRLQVRPGVTPRCACRRCGVFRRTALALLHGGLRPRRDQHGAHSHHSAHPIGPHRASQAAAHGRRASGQALAGPTGHRARSQRAGAELAPSTLPRRRGRRRLVGPQARYGSAPPCPHGARASDETAKCHRHPALRVRRRHRLHRLLFLHLGHPRARSLRRRGHGEVRSRSSLTDAYASFSPLSRRTAPRRCPPSRLASAGRPRRGAARRWARAVGRRRATAAASRPPPRSP